MKIMLKRIDRIYIVTTENGHTYRLKSLTDALKFISYLRGVKKWTNTQRKMDF